MGTISAMVISKFCVSSDLSGSFILRLSDDSLHLSL